MHLTRRKSLSAILTGLACAMLLLTACASAGASAGRRTKTLTRAHADCAARTARTPARTRARAREAALRGCRSDAGRSRPRRAQAHRAKPPVPSAAETAAAAAATSAQESSAAIAAALASTCQNTELTPEAANVALVRAAVLCLVNQERARNGRTPLIANADLEQAAEGHCSELIADDYFAHISPSGETPAERIRDTGYLPGPSVGYVIGENLAWGTLSLATPQAIVSAWIASPEHLANMLESQYKETGIGVAAAVPSSLAEGEPGATYAQEFGVIVR